MTEQAREAIANAHLNRMRQDRLEQGRLLLRGLRFINVHGQPLRMMPKLELDPALLEQPLYH